MAARDTGLAEAAAVSMDMPTSWPPNLAVDETYQKMPAVRWHSSARPVHLDAMGRGDTRGKPLTSNNFMRATVSADK